MAVDDVGNVPEEVAADVAELSNAELVDGLRRLSHDLGRDFPGTLAPSAVALVAKLLLLEAARRLEA